jgi:DNA primase
MPPKRFYQRKLVNGQWISGLNGVDRVLYNLDKVIKSDIVYVVEGEKDADRLGSIVDDWFCDIAVTTCPSGSGSWREEYNKYFTNKVVYIIPDNDSAGSKLALAIAEGIVKLARVVKIIKLPNLREKEDISDWFNLGFTFNDLKRICIDTSPVDYRMFIRNPQNHNKKKYNTVVAEITPDMLDIARNYPINKLIEVDGSGKAFCVNKKHQDSHRSMDTRRNFMYCYGCGYSGDVIRLAQFLFKCDFKTAVIKLCEISNEV